MRKRSVIILTFNNDSQGINYKFLKCYYGFLLFFGSFDHITHQSQSFCVQLLMSIDVKLLIFVVY